jgi:hypothetical protein
MKSWHRYYSQCQTSDFPDGIGLCDFAPYISGNSEIMTESMMTLDSQPLERWSVNSETASVRYIQNYLAADNIRHAVNFMRAMDCPPAATEGTGHVNIVYEKDIQWLATMKWLGFPADCGHNIQRMMLDTGCAPHNLLTTSNNADLKNSTKAARWR